MSWSDAALKFFSSDVTGRSAGLEVDGESWSVYERDTPYPFASGLTEADARLLVYGSPYGGLSDEAAGRAWAAKHGKRPERRTASGREFWTWRTFRGHWDAIPPSEHWLPDEMVSGCRMEMVYVTGADAYAALGRAVLSLAAVLT